jgi:actin-related protein 2
MLSLAGRDITCHLMQLLLRRGYPFNRTADFETVRQIKEKLCYVGYDLVLERRLTNDTSILVENYSLPDGRVVQVGGERFEASEAHFNPYILYSKGSGLSESIFDCINRMDVDLRHEYYNHIVLCGGSSLFPGFSSRLEKEIRQLFLERVLSGDETHFSKFKCRIEDPPARKYMVFLGGSVLAEIMKDKQEFWMNKSEWQEVGDQVLQKCVN